VNLRALIPIAGLLLGGAAAGGPERQVTNSVGMRLVWVEPGEFVMGSPDSDSDAAPGEKPQHRVRLTRGFYLGAHEVTVGQFRSFVRATGHTTAAEREGGYGWDREQKKFVQDRKYAWDNLVLERADLAQSERHPVVNVAWEDAAAFCAWLTRKEGKRYRLPSEAEWEYGCRAGTATRYHVGEGLEPTQANYGRNLGSPAPVGSYPPNGFGLFDMHGNVWEFCSDWHDPGYYRVSPVADPPGPGSAEYRARRGGDWLHGKR
jgi:formylglycine-generating enzyme required for sulfatase activity